MSLVLQEFQNNAKRLYQLTQEAFYKIIPDASGYALLDVKNKKWSK